MKLSKRSLNNSKFFSLLLFVFMMLPSVGFSQDEQSVDQLLKELKTAKKDTTKIRLLLGVAQLSVGQDIQKAKKYIARARSLSIKNNCSECEIKVMVQWALILNSENDTDSTLTVLNNAMVKARTLAAPAKFDFQTMIYGEIGNTLRSKGDYVKAIDAYESGINLAIKHGLDLRKAKLFNSLGGLYQEIEEKEKGLYYCKKSLVIYKTKFPDNTYDITLLSANIGNLLLSNQKYNEAEKYLIEANERNKKLNNPYLSSLINSGLGICEISKKEYQEALKYLNKALAESKRSRNIATEIALTSNIGSVYIQLKQFDKAESILIPAYEKACVSEQKYLIKEALSIVIELYAQSNQFEKAFNYQKDYIKIKNELFDEDLNNRIAQLDKQIKTAERENKIAKLNSINQRNNFKLRQKNYFIIIGSTLFILILIFPFIIIQRIKYKNREQIYSLENKMFRLQMKPHFIFNVLSSIQSYMSLNNGKMASLYLAKFARLIRNVLEQSQQEFTTIASEVEILNYYLELQQLRYENKFDFIIEIDESIDDEITLIPPMLIQPFVENAVEHGLSEIVNNGIVKVTFVKNDQYIIVCISDNGIGMKKGKIKNDGYSIFKGKSMSTNIISDQLKHYTKKYRKQFNLSLGEQEDATPIGTAVYIKLPFINQL